MGALPDIVVEIAFDSGWATPAADRTWTNVTDYVEVAETGVDFISIGSLTKHVRATDLSMRFRTVA